MNNRKMLIYAGILIVVVIGILFLVQPSTNAGKDFVQYDDVLVPQAMLQQFHVSSSLLSTVGIGASAGMLPQAISSNTPLVSDNKTEVFYMGADYCPYCAAERWPLIIALSRFGNFSSLHFMTSSPVDYAASTPTFTFVNSTYSSDYISFASVETQKNTPENGIYPPLQTPTDTQKKILNTYNYQESIPFIDFGNRSVLMGATFDPQLLSGKNWSEIIAAVNDPNTTISQAILGSANLITAAICSANNNVPASICNSTYIRQMETHIK